MLLQVIYVYLYLLTKHLLMDKEKKNLLTYTNVQHQNLIYMFWFGYILGKQMDAIWLAKYFSFRPPTKARLMHGFGGKEDEH